MELDERLRWIEIRVTSSIKPRAEEIKWLFSNKENREIMFEFCNNDEKRHLIIHSSNIAGEGLVASFKAPSYITEKAIFFVKLNHATKLTRDNVANDVVFCDCSKKPLNQLKRLVKDVYLPLLSIEHGGSVSADKLMDLLHRVVASLYVFDGNVQDKVALPLPSIEVLSEAAAFSGRRPAVIHVLETTVVQWIKQIKVALKLDPDQEIGKYGGKSPGPLTEIEMWTGHLNRLNFINEQLRSPVAVNILMNLEEANSSYGQSFHLIKKELSKAETECHINLQYLSTLLPWFQNLNNAVSPSVMVKIFPPLMHTLFLVWMHSRYYHEKVNFYRLLSMLSNEVVQRAKSLVYHSVFDELDESFQSLKDALRVCASFRGCYLDKKDKADDINRKKLADKSNVSSSEQLDVTKKKVLNDTPQKVGQNGVTLADSWSDSPWPARNNTVFARLNNFMERCNDVLELVQTTTHFKKLQLAADVGGAGGANLDSLVKEIYINFEDSILSIKESNLHVLEEDESRQFEKKFFSFRSVMMNLERRLADVLRQSFKQCPDTVAKLRLLEVFEGASGRELVQENLFDICEQMLTDFTVQLLNVKDYFNKCLKNPPEHVQLPPVASKLMWLKGLRARTGDPMSMFRKLSVGSFKGDKGWKLRDTYTDLIKEIERTETSTINEWKNTVQDDLRTKLKQPLLVYKHDLKTGTVQVNLDPELVSLLKEVSYLADPPFSIKLPEQARLLLRNLDITFLRSTAAKLETIVSRYNAINNNMQPYEFPLFERKMMKVNELIQQGVKEYTWRTVESTDFIEHLCSLVCEDVHKNLYVVQRNHNEICNIAASWSDNCLLENVFSSHFNDQSYSINELDREHKKTHDLIEHSITMGGNRIHALLLSTFEAVQISRASPAWETYVQYISDLVLKGLKKSVIVSLAAMIDHLNCFSKESIDCPTTPVLTIRLELSGSQVVFNPKLDEEDAELSVREHVKRWLHDYLKRGDMVKPLEPGLKTYQSLIIETQEVQAVIDDIQNIVQENAVACQDILDTFRQYAFLWMQDVEGTFRDFLAGNIVAHPRYMTGSEMIRSEASLTSQKSKREGKDGSSSMSTGAYSLDTSGVLGLSEKSFLNPKDDSSAKDKAAANVPSLDDFDKEIEIFRTCRDEIHTLEDTCDIGFARVNMCPIKQVLQTYASKWMFTYTKYLSDQVSSILNDLDTFLKRIEPGVEAITGEERDITSFMRLMGIFNEINTQQAEMDSKFIAMKRSIMLLEKFDQKLPDTTGKFYVAAPQKWNNLKMKVAQAKQRLGPRIQADEKCVTEQLEAFGKRCDILVREFMKSEAFNRKCLIYTAFNIMDLYTKKMVALEKEAEDLIELQELLEKNVVNFSTLTQLGSDLECLRKVWNIFRAVQEQQNSWRRERWFQLDTKILTEGLSNQLELFNSLPSRSNGWDVTMGMLDSIVNMQNCLPIVDDLQKAALRPRHWKQLMRLAGDNTHPVPNEGLVRMSLGQLIEFGLHQHADDVRAIIQKASKDVAIESSLKTYEEVWLSKVFELKPHKKARASSAALVTAPDEDVGSEIDSEAQGVGGQRGLSGRFSVTSYGSGGLSHKESKTRRTTPSLHSGAFSQSLVNLSQDTGPICLLTNCDPIFDELESHQVALQSMVCGAAARSFTDDILNWQKQLHTIEAVLTVWLEVQEKWVELEDIYASFEIRIALPHESNLFASVNRDFRILMKATEKNTNVLQSCSRANIQAKLEKMQVHLQQCWKALLVLLERRQQKFPRFYFLSPEDVLHVICNGHDPALVNPYLSKVYENIASLQYSSSLGTNPSAHQLTGVVSVMEEQLAFPEAVLCDATVELWLSNVEKSTKSVLNNQLKNLLNDNVDVTDQSLSYLTNNDKAWIFENSSEIVCLVAEIYLNNCMESCLNEKGKNQKNSLKLLSQKISLAVESLSHSLKSYEQDMTKSVEKIDKTSSKRNSLSTRGTYSRASGQAETPSLYSAEESVKTKQNTESVATPLLEEKNPGATHLPSQTHKITNLTILLINKRNIIQTFLDNINNGDLLSTRSFEWSSRIKYEYSKEDGCLSLKLLDDTFSYGMEYQGACPRLVITPMTNQYFVSLAQAVKMHMIGMCIGPANTQKDETVHDFARACGRPFYPFTCTSIMDQSFITGVFKGLAMTGSWICLRQVNFVERSILAVAVQLLQVVLNSLKKEQSCVLIDNDEIPLIASGAIFATINSVNSKSFPKSFDYFLSMPSTLSELPKRLLDKLRSVCFVKPDTRTIAEMCLVAHGFTTAKKLSKAIVKLQTLCESCIPSFSVIHADTSDIPSCMSKGSSWSALCIRRIVARASTILLKKDDAESNVINEAVRPDVLDCNIEGDDTQGEGKATRSETPNTSAERVEILEESCLVEAIRDTFSPGLSDDEATMLAVFTIDSFEGADVPMVFNSESTIDEHLVEEELVTRRSDLPVENPGDENSKFEEAISSIGLQHGSAFQGRVTQLANLVSAHKTVAVVGPTGCGKTECIKTVAAIHRQSGCSLRHDIVCTGTLNSSELMGYFDKDTREWKDGLLTSILRKYAHQCAANESKISFSKWIHLDGVIDNVQSEAFDAMLQNNGTVVLPNGERIRIPATLAIIWEMENLNHVSPSTISKMGLLCMNEDDVSTRLITEKWINTKQEREAELLRTLCDRYIDATLQFLFARTSVPPQPGAPPTKTKPQPLEHVVFTSELNMVETLIALVEATVSNHPDLMPAEYENYFNFAAIWAFGGTLIEKHRVHFSQWWKKTWKDFIVLPGNEEVWNYVVSSETNEFCLWSENLPPYAVAHGEGIPHDAYVHTVHNENLSYLVGLLSDVGRPVMLVGEQGCGKTSVIRDKLTNQDGDVAELRSLHVCCNQFTTSRTLWTQVDDCLEWKHGRTYVPKGNKKLVCLVDDLNLSKVNHSNMQTANELIRGLIDHGGSFDPDTQQWRDVQDVTYHTTYNPYTSATVPKIDRRLLRHFSLFHVSYPSVEALETVYSCLLSTHFFVSKQPTSGSMTQVLFEGSTAESHTVEYINDDDFDSEASFRDLINNVVLATIELQNDLRVMYLPTAPRCHYIFTMSDLTMVFRNTCLSLCRDCSAKDLLLLWKHECDWVYNRRLVDHVDRERYQQTFVNAVKKEFSSPEQIQILLNDVDVVFTNLVEADEAIISSGVTTPGNADKNVQLAYKPLRDINKVKTVLSHGIAEYNKDFPKIKLVLYKDTIEAICRLIRVLQSPHECSHATIVSEGSPGATSSIIKLAAHLCGFSLYQINCSSITGVSYTVENFKTDLVTSYRRAGVKREKLLLLLGENDLVNNDMMVYISEFLVSSSIAHLFSEEERTSAINSVRSDVTQAGLTYNRDVAWKFFLKTVKENLRIVLYVSSPGSQFQRRCREFPGLTNNVPVMFFPHSSQENLVARATYLLRDVELLDTTGKENMAHLFASMHLSLRQNDVSDDPSGSHGHITDTTFEKFTERFNDLFKKRHMTIRLEYDRMTSAVKNIDQATEMAEQRLRQLEHEKMVLEQKRESNTELLSQIGQDKAIAEEQVKLVTKQREKITQLQKALPKLKEANERAVFKAAAIVSDIKRSLQTLDIKALGELRALQKPDPEVEDVLAAVIIIIKSPTSDLTWNKGAKRLMANLDRFCDELSTFDELVLPENTLKILDTYLLKPHFNAAFMGNRTNNSAVVILVTWVTDVVRYHTMLLTKVKPLHYKVEETSATVKTASDKLSILNNKLNDLDVRLNSLAKAYEEASIDKCRQKERTDKLNTELERAEYFEKVLFKARKRWNECLLTFANREATITGVVCMATAFATYMGPYDHEFRRTMLSEHWPKCLRERGVPLEVSDFQYFTEIGKTEDDQNESREEEANIIPEDKSEKDEIEENKDKSFSKVLSDEATYDGFVFSLITTLVDNQQVRVWTNIGMGIRLMENAAISLSSWQRPPLLVDANGRGLELVRKMENCDKIIEVDAGDGDLNCLMNIERAITSGSILIIKNMNEYVDSIFVPLIYHINTTQKDKTTGIDGQSVTCGGRRLVCHPDFKLYLVNSSHFTQFSPEIASVTTLVNFSLDDASFAEEILSLSFKRAQPEVWREHVEAPKRCMKNMLILEDLDSKLMERLSSKDEKDIWDQTDLIADMVHCRSEVLKRLENAMKTGQKLLESKNMFQPLSRMATVLFKVINSLFHMQHEYRFSFDYFLSLFEIALSEVVPDEDKCDPTEPIIKQTTSMESEIVIKEIEESTEQSSVRKMSVVLPEEPSTPSLAYENAPVDLIRRLIDALTRTVSQGLFRSIYDHHRLTFGIMLASMIQKETLDDGTFDKQLHLLISGELNGTHHLTLADFDPTLLTPSWIPPARWQSLLSLSSLSGPLEGLCTKVATNKAWQEWYQHESPETIEFPDLDGPSNQNDETDEADNENGPQSDSFTEFHGLLIIRCLRPDRLSTTIKNYVVDILDSLHADIPASFSNILKEIHHSIPILILLPESSSLDLFVTSPGENVLQIAENENIACQRVFVASGHESSTDVALTTAVRTDSWIVIENIHLARVSWLNQLYIRLTRLRAQAESSSTKAQWRVFFTTKPNKSTPEPLLYLAHPIAWDFVQTDSNIGVFDRPLSVNLTSVITTYLNKIPRDLWEEVKRCSLLLRTYIFRVCIFHSILCTRSKFGARAMVKDYPFCIDDLVHTIKMILQLCITGDIQEPLPMERLLHSISEVVYGGKMIEDQDHEYRRCLARRVFNQQEESTLTIGEVTFPLPPINVEPCDYGKWFKDKIQDVTQQQSLTAVCPDTCSQVELDEFLTFSILEDLDTLKFDISHESTEKTKDVKNLEHINMVAVRRNLDMVLERLPSLLTMDGSKSKMHRVLPKKVFSQMRALSFSSAANSIMSSNDENITETMAFAIQQESEWFNTILCHIRQSLITLEERILCGAHAIPTSVNNIVLPLQSGLVPNNWLHVNWHPSSRSLYSWLDELHKCHNQLKKWVDRGLTSCDQVTHHGPLGKIWLGGLVNPAAILMSLKHDTSLALACPFEQVMLECYIGSGSFDEDPGTGVTLTGLYLEGAMWDDVVGLKISSSPLSKLSDVFVKAVYVADNTKIDKEKRIYNCPVYRNRSRQYCPFKLPLRCSVDVEHLSLRGVALIIDPGEIEDTWKLQT